MCVCMCALSHCKVCGRKGAPEPRTETRAHIVAFALQLFVDNVCSNLQFSVRNKLAVYLKLAPPQLFIQSSVTCVESRWKVGGGLFESLALMSDFVYMYMIL